MSLWESYYDAIKQQDWKKALRSLESLKRSEPKNPQAHLKIGDLLRRTGNINDAVNAYDRSASLLLLPIRFR
ncbi:MAG: tetratricopeptide repeat protein [Nitrospirota bacterium]